MLEVTRQGFYAWASRGKSGHAVRDEWLTGVIKQVHANSRKNYGAPRIVEALRKQQIAVSKRRVARLMRQAGLRGVCRAAKPRAVRKPVELEVAGDLVKRNFTADGPNRVWFADITYVPTGQGWLFLAIVFDVYSRMIVGWAMDRTMTAKLVDDALKMGILRRNPPVGLIHHSDRGSQYRSRLLEATMRACGIVPSMGAIGAPWDNAVTESLISTIKRECVGRQVYETRQEAMLSIFEYIEGFYNRERIHTSLGGMSPEEFERQKLWETVN